MTDVLFPWVESGGFNENWLEGLGFVGVGLFGALVTVYLFLGDFLPSMGGKAEYDNLRLEIQQLERRRDKLLTQRERFTREPGTLTQEQLTAAETLTSDLSAAIDAKDAESRKERRRLLALGLPIYIVLGGVFAVFFANNLLQAFLVGFGWTAVADRIGLTREVEQKTLQRQEETAKLTAENEREQAIRQQLEAQVEQLRDSLTRLADIKSGA